MIITIDGGCWTGKSTTAKSLAKILGYRFINTGAMFRAVAFLAHKKGVLENRDKVIAIAGDIKLNFNQENQLMVNDENLNSELEDPALVPLAAKIAVIPEVREALLCIQRRMGKEGEVVVEGRDAGTNIFPNADWKFYLDASLDIRAKRLAKVSRERGEKIRTHEDLKKEISETDYNDRNREIAPLMLPKDAIIYDNTESPTEERDAVVLWYYITHKTEILSNYKKIKK